MIVLLKLVYCKEPLLNIKWAPDALISFDKKQLSFQNS